MRGERRREGGWVGEGERGRERSERGTDGRKTGREGWRAGGRGGGGRYLELGKGGREGVNSNVWERK